MMISDAGLEALTREEGFVDHVYLDQVGKRTIGFGHLIRMGETFPDKITRAEGMALLRADLARFEACVDAFVRVPVNQGQFDALVSLAFNIGTVNFGTSTLVRKLNARDFPGAAAQFDVWRMGGGRVLPVLVKRRARERAMFERN